MKHLFIARTAKIFSTALLLVMVGIIFVVPKNVHASDLGIGLYGTNNLYVATFPTGTIYNASMNETQDCVSPVEVIISMGTTIGDTIEQYRQSQPDFSFALSAGTTTPIDYYINYFDTNACDMAHFVGSTLVHWNGVSWSTLGVDLGVNGSTQTRIISVVPYNNQTQATSTSFSLGATGYLNNNDLGSGLDVVLDWQLKNAQLPNSGGLSCGTDVFCSLPQSQNTFSEHFSSAFGGGSFVVSTTTSLQQIGEYVMHTKILKTDCFLFCLFSNQSVLVSTSTEFIVATTSQADKLTENTKQQVANLFGEASTTPYSDMAVCNLLNVGAFSPLGCLSVLFFPNFGEWDTLANNAQHNILTKFPVGYVTSFVTALASTSTSTLPVISATIPAGDVGAGSHIELGLSSISWIFTATTTRGALAGQSLWQIVEPYWDSVVYLSLVFYILMRILGTRIISKFI